MKNVIRLQALVQGTPKRAGRRGLVLLSPVGPQWCHGVCIARQRVITGGLDETG